MRLTAAAGAHREDAVEDTAAGNSAAVSDGAGNGRTLLDGIWGLFEGSDSDAGMDFFPSKASLPRTKTRTNDNQQQEQQPPLTTNNKSNNQQHEQQPLTINNKNSKH